MPVSIPNTTATTDFVNFGVGGVYSSGYLFVANGLIDILYYHGVQGSASPAGPFTLAPGLTPLEAGVAPNGQQLSDPIAGLGIRAANGVLSTPNAQQYFGALFEPGQSSVSAGAPFSGTLTAGGAITPTVVLPGAQIVGSMPQIIPTGTITGLSGQTYTTNSPAAAGIFTAQVTFSGININSNNDGFYLMSFETLWNSGSGDVNPLAVSISRGGLDYFDTYASTIFSTRTLTDMLWLDTGGLLQLSPVVYQSTGSNQTLTSWIFSILQLTTTT